MESLQASFKSMLTADRQDGKKPTLHTLLSILTSFYLDMRRFFFLLSRVENGLNHSSKTLELHVAAQGVDIVKEQASKKNTQLAMKSAIAFIQQVLNLLQARVSLH